MSEHGDNTQALARLTARAKRFYRGFLAQDRAIMISLAIVVGVTTGFAAVMFRRLVDGMKNLFFGGGAEVLGFMGEYYVVILPAVGGLLVGLLVYFLAREARGHGVPEVMEAVSLRGGRIRPVVVLVKALASSICIGSGGSAGREGPIVQIGSALGSSVGQLLKLTDRRIRNLVACGASSGIAATFNTPIAGVLFSLEVIARRFDIDTFASVVVAAVVATIVAAGFLGNEPAFLVPEYSMVSPWEIVLYMLLGCACAVVGVGFIKLLHGSESFFENKVKLPEYVQPAVGGLLVGCIGVFLPQVFGVGYDVMDQALWGRLGVGLLAVLVVAKVLATSLTLGSGGSGGVFAPSLFIGAMLGGSFGEAVNHLWPLATAPSGAYALVAMGALFAATARAPLSAVVILFEMTRDYAIILPLMFACAISTMLSAWLSKETIYTIKLKSRGVDLNQRKDFGKLDGIAVGEAMKPVARLTTVSPDLSLEAMARLFKDTFHHGYAVVDDSGDFFGVVTLKDLERVLTAEQIGGRKVRDVCTTRVVTAYPDESLEDVLERFGALDVGRIPVVDRAAPLRLLGMLRWSDIVRSYSQVMLDLEYESGTILVKCDIEPGDRAVGRNLRDIGLPPDCVVNSIQRGRHLVVPRGGSVVEAGDRLVILASEGSEEQVCTSLYGRPCCTDPTHHAEDPRCLGRKPESSD